MIKLHPQSFPFGSYDSSLIPHSIFLSDKKEFVEWLKEQTIIGYCESELVEVRARKDNYCVMFEEDGWQGWCHVPSDIFNTFLEQFTRL